MSNWSQDNEKSQFTGASEINRLSMKECKYTLRIISDALLFRFHWINAVNRSINCDGVNCPVCQEGNKGQLKYVCNVIDRADGKVKIWELGRRVKVAIQNIAEDYGSPEGYDLHVRRTGMKADNTVYTVTPAKDASPLTPEEQALPQYDLAKLYAITPAEKVAAYLRGEIPPKADADVGAPRQGKTETPVKQQAPEVQADDLPTL